MNNLLSKIKSWFKPKKHFKEIESIEHSSGIDPTDSIDGLRYSLDYLNGGNIKKTQAEKMRELASKNRNKKPFYKDDKAKEWEQ